MFPGVTAAELFAPCPPDRHPEAMANGEHPQVSLGHVPMPAPAPIADTKVFGTLPVGLRPHIERAFERDHVTIDFAGFSGETLHGALQEPLDKIRSGLLSPRSISIRLLVPDTSTPMVVPCRTDDLADDPDFRARAEQIMLRYAQAITATLDEFVSLGHVQEATAQIRVHHCAPLFKLYILNDEQVFFGFYPIREHRVPLNGSTRSMYDLMGKEAMLFQHSADEHVPANTQYVAQARIWFDSVWNTISREFTL